MSTPQPLFESKAFESKAKDAAQLQSRILGHHLTPFYDDGRPARRYWSHCQGCGDFLVIDPNSQSMQGAAWSEPCHPNALRALEAGATLIGLIPVLLAKRFEQELTFLAPTLRERFRCGELRTQEQVMLSRDGVWSLSWQLRDEPELPIDDENRQSAGGLVLVEQVVPDACLLPARYCGPRLNPNGHEDRARWAVFPLESGECGVAYTDCYGRHRFRRAGGVVGYFIQPHHFVLELVALEPVALEPDNPAIAPSEYPALRTPLPLFEREDLPPQAMAYP